MVYIYQADDKFINAEISLDELLLKLPVIMHERAKRYKFEQDAYHFVLGRLLLKQGLEHLGMGDQFAHIEYQKKGKPFLKGVFFNISHTENRIVCAISTEGEIGIDVEIMKSVKLTDFGPWFTENEWMEINNTTTSIHRFYEYWTRKESIVKALGVNISYLHRIEVDITQDHFLDQDKKWYLKALDFGSDYVGALCSENPIGEVNYIFGLDCF